MPAETQRATKLYDRTSDGITLNEVERNYNLTHGRAQVQAMSSRPSTVFVPLASSKEELAAIATAKKKRPDRPSRLAEDHQRLARDI
jgi:hypothetical protein